MSRYRRRHYGGSPVDFERVNQAALAVLPELVKRWLPNGRRDGEEWIALNPTRRDRHLGSFRVNLRRGVWCDFAVGDKGGDVVALVAYLERLSQVAAAKRLSDTLGLGNER